MLCRLGQEYKTDMKVHKILAGCDSHGDQYVIKVTFFVIDVVTNQGEIIDSPSLKQHIYILIKEHLTVSWDG